MKLTVTINGKPHTIELSGNEILLDVLRDNGFHGVKRGCENGDCGACAVIVDGRAMCSCLMMAGQVEGRQVTTCEGLGDPVDPHPLQDSFVHCGAAQCGFCIPGMIVSAKELIDDHPEPTFEQMKEALDGNLCRCTGYTKQFEAVREAAAALAKEHPPAIGGNREAIAGPGPKSGPKGLARPAKAPAAVLEDENPAAKAVRTVAKAAKKAAKRVAKAAKAAPAKVKKAAKKAASTVRKAVKKIAKKAAPRKATIKKKGGRR